MAKKTSKKASKPVGNGLKTFSMHSKDDASYQDMAALTAAESAHPSFAAAANATPVDPETAARRYLDLALGSPAVSNFTAPVADEVPSEFKSLDTETIPLTGTTMVKFRQYFSKIPVYGSLVTVELDDANKLLGINSALGTPQSVSPVARISPAEAVKAVKAYPGHAKDLDKIVPRLNYYFDRVASKWRLVFILEDVPVVAKTKVRSPVLMDYVVDAHTGKVVTEIPRTPHGRRSENGRGRIGQEPELRGGQSRRRGDLEGRNAQRSNVRFQVQGSGSTIPVAARHSDQESPHVSASGGQRPCKCGSRFHFPPDGAQAQQHRQPGRIDAIEHQLRRSE